MLVAFCLCLGQETERKTELEGKWEIVERSIEGSYYTEEEIKEMLVRWLVFRGNKLIALDKDGKVKNETTFKVDPKQEPATMDAVCQDLVAPTGMSVFQYIYKLRGDTLTVCWQVGSRAAKRPKDFNNVPGSNLEVLTLKRVKE
ncbi:MAG: TIGR03067 domain-containing protein [Gemmatales bacterium]|nr:TIGR03067 domain-containing protein [Gemmatales bacterium]